MIYCDSGSVGINGDRPQALAELATLVKGLRRSGFSEDDVLFACMAGLNYEEVEKNPDETLSVIRKVIANRK